MQRCSVHQNGFQLKMPFAQTYQLSENGFFLHFLKLRDSNGTVFGYNPKVPGHQAGEFGHNDFYTVIIAASQ
jgi:hypothetical protein